MSISCTRCGGTGFLNLEFLPDSVDHSNVDEVLAYLSENPESDVSVCDCCGDGYAHYGVPGEHYGADDPIGDRGPYAANGGLCCCH